MQLQQHREKLTKLEALSLRFEQKMDEKDNILFHSKLDCRNRSVHLKKMIQDLRTKYSGCLPLEKQVSNHLSSKPFKSFEMFCFAPGKILGCVI